MSGFEKVMKPKSDSELQSIISDEENYSEEARLSAIAVLESRKGESEGFNEVKESILETKNRKIEYTNNFHKDVLTPEGMPQ